MRIVCMLCGSIAATTMATVVAAEPQADDIVAYVSSLDNNAIIKLQDLTGDGTYNAPGESVVFFGPGNGSGLPGLGGAQSLLVLEYDHLLVADGESAGRFEQRLYRLRDAGGDGVAMNTGEAQIFWDGVLPIDGTPNVDRPKAVTRGPDGAIYIADNNTLNAMDRADTPEAVWRLEDRTGSDVVSASVRGEVELHHQLCAPGDGFCFITEAYQWSADGRLFFTNMDPVTNTTSVWIIERDGRRIEFASENDLLGIGLTATGLAMHPVTDNPVLAGYDLNGRGMIVELADNNDRGFIDNNAALNVLYRADEAADAHAWSAAGDVMDIAYAPDGSLWLLDNATDRIVRFDDLSGDGAYHDAGEARVVYEAAVVEGSGGIAVTFPRAIDFAVVPDPALAGDLTRDGRIGASDLSALLDQWGDCVNVDDCPADLDSDGAVDGADLGILLLNWSE